MKRVLASVMCAGGILSGVAFLPLLAASDVLLPPLIAAKDMPSTAAPQANPTKEDLRRGASTVGQQQKTITKVPVASPSVPQKNLSVRVRKAAAPAVTAASHPVESGPSISPVAPVVTPETPPAPAEPVESVPMAVMAYSMKTNTVPVRDIPVPGSTFRPFYIFTDEKSQNHFYPSGWMGDTQDLKFSGAYQDDPRLGRTCLRITYLARGAKEWAGIYWQNPANNWGNVKGGYDLRGAAFLTFWAKGQDGGERISEFKIGGLSGKYPDSDVAWIGPITLKKQWSQYRIKLKDKDLRYISGGFCFTALRNDNPNGCTFYIDEIRYE